MHNEVPESDVTMMWLGSLHSGALMFMLWTALALLPSTSGWVENLLRFVVAFVLPVALIVTGVVVVLRVRWMRVRSGDAVHLLLPALGLALGAVTLLEKLW